MISKEEFASQKAAARMDQESSEDELVFQMENDQQPQQLSHSLPTTLETEHKGTAVAAHSGRRNRQKQRSGKDNRRARFYPIIPKDNDDQRVSVNFMKEINWITSFAIFSCVCIIIIIIIINTSTIMSACFTVI